MKAILAAIALSCLTAFSQTAPKVTKPGNVPPQLVYVRNQIAQYDKQLAAIDTDSISKRIDLKITARQNYDAETAQMRAATRARQGIQKKIAELRLKEDAICKQYKIKADKSAKR